jgi:hypothetical protein
MSDPILLPPPSSLATEADGWVDDAPLILKKVGVVRLRLTGIRKMTFFPVEGESQDEGSRLGR